LTLAAAVLLAWSTGAAPAPAPLRVCADPNNLPFSNRAGEGFENAIASLIAQAMGARVDYAWWPQRRGWVRNTLAAHKCDVAIGVPVGYDPVLTTRPYYRSSYVFVSRADRRYGLASLDDPRLRTLRIGLHWVALDGDEPPPAHALAARGIVRNIVGFSLFGNYGRPNPPAELIHAVARDSVDVAIAWGPLAGYFAKHEGVPIAVTPVTPAVDRTGQPFTFAIAMGVRRGDTARRDRLQSVIDAHAREIRAILDRFGVPVVDAPAASLAERGR
jgi:quinoprotein dehydrogenase-associated probable ABC transporter substrate-binding protein